MEKLLILLLVSSCMMTAVTASKMEMPSFVTSGDKVVIECQLDHKKDVIEHFKWYKDNQLFYLVVPANDPQTTKIDLQGVPVNMNDSKMEKIVLNSVTDESSGLYTCELKLEDRMVRMSGTLTVHPAKE